MSSHKTLDAARPASKAIAVTPSDATILETTRSLYVGATGDVVVTMADQGGPITFINVPDGYILPVQVTQVLAATTATSIIALY